MGRYSIPLLALIVLTIITLFACNRRSRLTRDIYYGGHGQKVLPYIGTKDSTYIIREIGKSRIVLIGEESHDNGAMGDMMVELVKFLHRNLDFKVVLVEQSFIPTMLYYDRIDSCQLNSEAYLSILTSLFADKGNYDLVSYLYQQRSIGEFFFVGGMDVSLSKEQARMTLSNMEGLLGEFALNKKWDEYRKLILMERECVNPIACIDTLDALTQLIKDKISTNPTVTDLDKRKWMQILKNVQSHYYWYNTEFIPLLPKNKHRPYKPGSMNTRDMQMGDNVNWFLNDQFPNEKIIVLTSLNHTFRKNGSSVKTSLAMDTTMAEYIDHKYSDSLYSIAMITADGYLGTGGIGSEDDIISCYSIEKRKKGNIERRLYEKGEDFMFMDLSDMERSMVNKKYKAKATHGLSKAKWSDHYDAFYFIRESYPDSLFLSDLKIDSVYLCK